MPFIFRFFLLSFFVSACEINLQDDPKLTKNPEPSEEVEPETAPLTNEESQWTPNDQTRIGLKNSYLLFSTIDPLAAPWQAEIHSLDLETGLTQKILSGESSDPGLFFANDRIWLFNRSYASQNFRSILPIGGDFKVSQQMSFAAGSGGDPHDVIALSSGHLLTANYSSGSLQILDPSTGTVVDEVKAQWNLPEGSALKPESLISLKVETKTLIYVVHQSLEVKYNLVLSNGSQQVFVLEEIDGKILPVDMDLATPAIDGIKIKGSFPVPLRHQNAKTLRLVSFCSLLTSHVDGFEDCRAAIEEINPSSQTATVLWDLDGSDYFMNGMTAAGPNPDVFYANVDQKLSEDLFEKRVLRFDTKEKTAQSVYRFNQDAGGFWGVFYDQDRQVLYVGDQSENLKGKLVKKTEVEILENKSGMVIELDAVPYSGAFSRKAVTQ